MVMMHVWFIGLLGHFGEIAGKNSVRPLFLLIGVFLFSRNPTKRFWGLILWHLGVEVLNVGSWLTHGDLALEAGVDTHNSQNSYSLHGVCGVLNSEVASAYLGKQRKALSTSTRCGVRRSAVDEHAHSQQTPLKMHVETWARPFV